ncbi:hypothetical protein ACIGW3_28145 [Streptomyces sp. NPDC053499]|uniref:hypothetical protein n=1 Tax=Streptomyces sp. NPDC053499 TaxID=3365707 RepID=UPI0037CDE6F5
MGTNTSRRMAAVALISAALVTGGATSGYAAQQTGAGTSGTTRVTAGDGEGSGKGLAATRWASCTAQVNNPHWSRGARSVIFKTRVACTGNIARVHVKVTGKLYRKSGSKWHAVAGSKETKVKATNGKVSTYYTPRPSGRKATLDGTYKGKITVQITSPFPGTKGTASSKAVKVNTPGK